MADDDLTRAAQRAQEVLPDPLGTAIAVVLLDHAEDEHPDPNVHELAHVVLRLPVAAPSRDAVAKVLMYALLPAQYTRVVDTSKVADALISAGLVRGPVTAEQIETAAKAMYDEWERHWQPIPTWATESDDLKISYRDMARTAAKALGLSVEGDETHG